MEQPARRAVGLAEHLRHGPCLLTTPRTVLASAPRTIGGVTSSRTTRVKIEREGFRVKRFFVGVIAAVALAIPAAAVADSCANVSRPAPECNLSCTSLVTDGN